MTDRPDILPPNQQMPQILPIQKVTAKIGDGSGTLFAVDHPQASFVVVSLFRALGGDAVHNLPHHEQGRVVFAFARPPQPEEFIAVVIG